MSEASEAMRYPRPGDSELVMKLQAVQLYLKTMGIVFPIAPEIPIATIAEAIDELRKGVCVPLSVETE